MKKLHQPDINGTHVPIDTPFTKAVAQLFREWIQRGNIFAPNTSYTIKKIAQNIQGIANGLYITELGVAVYAADAKTLVRYHPFTLRQRAIAGDYFSKHGEKDIQAAGFFPRCEAQENHGIFVYIHAAITEQTSNYFLQRYHVVEKLTRDAKEFATWLISLQKDIGLIEWKPFRTNLQHIPSELSAFEYTYKYSYDSGGTCFVTPKGITKATTFEEVLAMCYRDIPRENISIAGDSLSTDESLFTIPGITHIAVKERKLLRNVQGKNIFAETPEEAHEILREIMLEGKP